MENWQNKGTDHADIKPKTQRDAKSHENSELSVADIHADKEQRAKRHGTEQQVKQPRKRSGFSAKGAEHIVQETQRPAKQHGAERLRELDPGINLHQ